MRPVVPVVLALLLASCTAGTADRSASGSPTPSATQAPSSTERSLVLAVRRKEADGLLLYRVDRARVARPIGRIDPPPGHRANYGFSLGGDSTPDVCVLWGVFPVVSDAGGADAAYCYADGAGQGRRVPTTDSLGVVALAADGRRLFWSSVGEGEQVQEGVVADYSQGATRAPRRFDISCSTYLLSAVWAGQNRLALHCTSGDNDDPGSLWTQGLGSGSGAPQEDQRIGDYEQFASPGSADATSVIALERHCDSGCDTAMPRMRSPRAVRVDLRTGRVLEVIATPAEGRYVAAVTGGAHGVVYVTDAEGSVTDRRVYLRWPGEKHGTLIIGLPDDVEKVVAQP